MIPLLYYKNTHTYISREAVYTSYISFLSRCQMFESWHAFKLAMGRKTRPGNLKPAKSTKKYPNSPFWSLSHKYLKEGAKFLSKLLTAATVSQSVLEASYHQCLLIWHHSFMFYREFFYIQMEKYARQALSEGVKSDTELHVTEESELYRVINVHYNRNNHIEVSFEEPFTFWTWPPLLFLYIFHLLLLWY